MSSYLYRLSFLIIFPALVFIGCAGKSVVKNESNEITNAKDDNPSIVIDKKKAMEHYINGSVLQSNDKHVEAITEFEKALLYDTAATIYYELGRSYYNIGTNKYPQALFYVRKAINQNKSEPAYYLLASDIFISSRMYDSASAYLEKILQFDTTRIEVYYKLARLYEVDKPLSAIEIYNGILEKIGYDWDVLLRISELYQKIGNIDAAIKSVEDVLNIDPGNIYIKKLLFELYKNKKDYDKAFSIINDIIEVTPDDLEAREKKAQIFIEQEKWKEAAEEYIFIIMQPDIPYEGKLRIAESYFIKSFTDTLLKNTAKEIYLLLDNDSVKYDAKMILGAIAFDEGNDSLAHTYYSSIPVEGKDAVTSWLRLGGIYYDNKKYNTVTKIFTSVYADLSTVFEINLLLGISYTQLGNYEMAKAFLEKSVEITPGDLNALSALGYTLNRIGQNEEAIKYLNLALKIDPKNVDILGTLGMIYNSQENWHLCDSVYEKAIELEPDNALINNNYSYSLSERGIQLERAFKMIKIAIEKEPYNSSYLDTYGWVCYKLGNYDTAIEYINKAIEVAGESSVMLDHLGDVFFSKNDKEKALHYWQKALEMDKSNLKIKNKIDAGGF